MGAGPRLVVLGSGRKQAEQAQQQHFSMACQIPVLSEFLSELLLMIDYDVGVEAK